MSEKAFAGIWLAVGVGCALAPGLSAQFHSKKANGQTGVNEQAVTSAQRQAASSLPVGASSAMAGAAVTGGGISGGDTILPEETRRALAENNVRLGQMQGKPIDIWGRAIHHSDGSFTESKQDLETNTLEQVTKSKNGVRLQRRMVMLDERGQPSEVQIYDGRDQFKYRGVLIYDRFGRFEEEQIYDTRGTLIRRKVQEYDPRGDKMPMRSWDYVANVPEDLRLVITRDDQTAPGGLQAPPRSGAAASVAGAPAGGSPPAVPAKKGPLLPRLFGSKK